MSVESMRTVCAPWVLSRCNVILTYVMSSFSCHVPFPFIICQCHLCLLSLFNNLLTLIKSSVCLTRRLLTTWSSGRLSSGSNESFERGRSLHTTSFSAHLGHPARICTVSALTHLIVWSHSVSLFTSSTSSPLNGLIVHRSSSIRKCHSY